MHRQGVYQPQRLPGVHCPAQDRQIENILRWDAQHMRRLARQQLLGLSRLQLHLLQLQQRIFLLKKFIFFKALVKIKE